MNSLFQAGYGILTAATAGAKAAEPMPTPSFPTEWQINLQSPATPVMEQIAAAHHMLLWVTAGIAGVVLTLILICIFRFNAKSNPVASTTTHNTALEVLWTAIPVIILLIIAVPGFRMLFFMDRVEKADMTLKVAGNQWYWSYEYPDFNVSFDAIAIPDDQIDPSKGQRRMLETDNHVVVPTNTNIRVLLTATDVIHSWAVPAFGVKTDAMPGRTNETWMRVTKPGRFYGQCSELCGIDHSLMPIVVDAVSPEEFHRWLASKNATPPHDSAAAAAQN